MKHLFLISALAVMVAASQANAASTLCELLGWEPSICGPVAGDSARPQGDRPERDRPERPDRPSDDNSSDDKGEHDY